MDKLIDYVRWVGDLDFDKKPFCDMDVLILCVVGYLDMKPVYQVSGMGTPDVKNNGVQGETMIPKVEKHQKMTIREVSRRIREQGLTYYVRTVGPDNGQIELQDAIAASKRFGDVLVKDYVDEFDHDSALQFSAMTFEAAGKRIISYCGTDHTIAGWKEDFMISFTHPLAQNKAVEYAHRAIEAEPEVPFILSGHSKGGNLALYAACMISDEDWDHVEHVYDLDGPGLCPEVVDLSVLDRIQDRTTLVGPEYAVISKLFKVNIKDTRIIASAAEGMMQHGLYSWCTDHGKMMLLKEHDPRSLALNQAIDQWMADLSAEERKHFVDQLFDALSAGGKAVTIDDIGAKGGPSYEEVFAKVLAMDEKTRQIFKELPMRTMLEKDMQLSIESTLEKARREGPVAWFLKHEEVQGIAVLLAGVLTMLLTGTIVNLAILLPMILLVGIMVGLTGRKLIQNGWNFEAERLRVSLTIVVTGALLVMILKEGAADMLGTMAIGTLLMVYAYTLFLRLRKMELMEQRHRENLGSNGDDDNIFMTEGVSYKAEDTFGYIILVLECVFSAVFGVALLLIPVETIHLIAMIIGGGLIADGILHLIHGIKN